MVGDAQHLMGPAPTPSISPYIFFYPFAEGGVLHWRQTHHIWVLNAASAYLWCLLEEVASTEELAMRLADRFAIDHATATRDVVLALDAFNQAGLLGETPARHQREEESPWQGGIPAGSFLVEPAEWAVRVFLQTPQQHIEFCCQDLSIGAEFAALTDHLKGQNTRQPSTRLAVLADAQAPGTWAIYLDGRLFIAGLPGGEVLPYLFTLLFVKGSEAIRDALLFHAAVIGRSEHALMFPAEAGSGKTTLAAALAARGHLFFSDELAILNRRESKLLPMPMPMSIKPGSTSVLERYYPGLAAKPSHPRSDGQSVRYLAPPPGAIAALDSRAAIEAIVFPRYREGASTSLVALDKISALQRLVQTGSSDRELEPIDIEALIAAVETHPCYTLEYADLTEVVQLLENSFASLGHICPDP